MNTTYPLLPTKSQQIQQEVQEKGLKLQELIKKAQELNRFKQFSKQYSEINELLKESEDQSQNEENIYLIDVTINKITRLIQTISEYVKERINQLEFLTKLVEKYFDKVQINSINIVLNGYKTNLQKELDAKVISKENINICLNELDHCLTLKKIQEEMLDYFQNKNVNKLYEKYKTEIIRLLESNEDEVKTRNNNKLSEIVFLENSIITFEMSYQHFEAKLTWIDYYEKAFQTINPSLLDLGVINERKSEVQKLINDLNSLESIFDPTNVDSLNILDERLSLLADKLYELNKINLEKQHSNLIGHLIDSKNNLAMHAEKLKSSFLWVKSSKSKYQVIENIQQKIEALLKSQENQEQTTINQESITELQQTINEAKAILSEYRGISLLRCFATLWGGGKVTSQLLVETLEEQVADLQRLPPSL